MCFLSHPNIKKNKIISYSYAIPKFCNQSLIDVFEKKENLRINIINHIFDPDQLIFPRFTLNFKNIIYLHEKLYNIHNNKEKNQDSLNKEYLKNHIMKFSLKNHSSIFYFHSLIQT